MMKITDLPLLVQMKILRSFSYAELSRLRSLSKHFHRLCAEQLNHGFSQLEILVHQLQRQIKLKLPRRESERHKHPLSAKFDIISSLDSRIQWLKLTFASSIQNCLCCFYPGRLLDEIYSVLNQLQSQTTCLNTRSLLQETRDMSSMAIEHFREHIEPKFEERRRSSLISNVSCSQRLTNVLLRRLSNQELIIKSQKYQLKHYKNVLHRRSQALKFHHRRLKVLEKKSKATDEILIEMRKDNETFVQRFDQFLFLSNSKWRKPRKVT